jgi:hypothetical protein
MLARVLLLAIDMTLAGEPLGLDTARDLVRKLRHTYPGTLWESGSVDQHNRIAKWLKFAIQRSQYIPSEACSHFSNIFQFPFVVCAEEQRAKAFPITGWFSVADDDELVLLVHFYLQLSAHRLAYPAVPSSS